MHYGLVVVSASRSRPYQRATGGGSGRQIATCLLVSPVFRRMGVLTLSLMIIAVHAMGP